MNLSAAHLPFEWLLIAHLLYAAVLLFSMISAPWYHLKQSEDAHVFFAASILLWLAWRTGVGITGGMEFHLLLATSVTLMFGWQFAVFATSLAQLCLTLEGTGDWLGYSLNLWVNGMIPIAVTFGLFKILYISLPKHFFIYIYGSAFFGGALSMAISRSVGMAILLLSGAYTWLQLQDQSVFIFIMLFPEAFINGLIMTVLVAYRPTWVSSFSDQHYLKGK